MELRADAGRLEQRLGGGGFYTHVPGRHGLANRRLDHAAGDVLRRGGHEAVVRPRALTRHSAAGAVDGPPWADWPLCPRPGDHARSDRRPVKPDSPVLDVGGQAGTAYGPSPRFVRPTGRTKND